jgi:1-acyl-sn-glycerol-3-phosphate acyltransferase
MKSIFYIIIKCILTPLFFLIFRPKVIGKSNIPKNGSIVLAGNHTNNLDSVMLIAVVSRQVHFLAKIELFKGIFGVIVKAMGCIPVNRKIHDKDALKSAKDVLKNNKVIGIYPEGTINRTDDIIMPFKIGAVKMAKDTNTKIVPFVITGKYNIIGPRVKIEFLESIEIKDELNKENDKLMKIISKKLEEDYECN